VTAIFVVARNPDSSTPRSPTSTLTTPLAWMGDLRG
jgi:hypothetical protein